MFTAIKSYLSGLTTKASLPLSSATALDLFGPVSATGSSIGAETAMRVPAVAQGVGLISQAIGTLGVEIYRETPKGREEVTDHPALAVLRSPNAWTARCEFISQIVSDQLLHGDGVAVAVRVRDEVKELHRVDPRGVLIEVSNETLEPVYRATMLDGSQRTYNWRDVIHVKQRSTDGLRGLGLLHTAREAISLAITLEAHANKLFAAGARPSGILTTPGRLDKNAMERLRGSFEQRYAGTGGSGKTMILESGLTFSPLTFASTDAQFQEARAFQVVEIARALNMPATLLNDLSAATFSNAESLAQSFLDRTLVPHIEIVEAALERVLLTPEEHAAGYEIEFSTDNFARADISARFAAWAQAIQNGILTSNEVRAREGLPPVAGGDEILRTVQAQPVAAKPKGKTA